MVPSNSHGSRNKSSGGHSFQVHQLLVRWVPIEIHSHVLSEKKSVHSAAHMLDRRAGSRSYLPTSWNHVLDPLSLMFFDAETLEINTNCKQTTLTHFSAILIFGGSRPLACRRFYGIQACLSLAFSADEKRRKGGRRNDDAAGFSHMIMKWRRQKAHYGKDNMHNQ